MGTSAGPEVGAYRMGASGPKNTRFGGIKLKMVYLMIGLLWRMRGIVDDWSWDEKNKEDIPYLLNELAEPLGKSF